mmetsp:Transcript_18949/g.40751  ORF Transcript_18949/g.40751 Transcript_18949/m.40751 type:complete len:256 (+) Transcript_18949:1398-2165(+)
MVSANATSSSPRVLTSSSCVAFLVAQFFSKSAKNFLSSSRVSEVSPRSFFKVAISRPSAPERSSFASMAFESAATSFFFAAVSSSKDFTAASSVAMASFWEANISSLMVLRMPTISPLAGAYSESLERKERRVCRSSSSRSLLPATRRRKVDAAVVCKKLPLMPPSKAAMALSSATKLALLSPKRASKAAFSFSRSAVASAMAVLQASRSSLLAVSSSSILAFLLVDASMAGATSSNLASAASMLAPRSPPDVLQ